MKVDRERFLVAVLMLAASGVGCARQVRPSPPLGPRQSPRSPVGADQPAWSDPSPSPPLPYPPQPPPAPTTEGGQAPPAPRGQSPSDWLAQLPPLVQVYPAPEQPSGPPWEGSSLPPWPSFEGWLPPYPAAE